MPVELEKYSGPASRHTCPACNLKGSFVRYQNERGEYLSFDVGRCNHEAKCSFHYTPKDFFAANPDAVERLPKQGIPKQGLINKNGSQSISQTRFLTKPPDFIENKYLLESLDNYDQNAFVQFLFDLFPDAPEEIQSVLTMYFVGTYENYTSFPQIDRLNNICKAKLIRFNPATGKRLKGEFDTSSLVRKLKLKNDFQYKQIFFGEHLLGKFPDKPVAIVEAEKTAIIASLCFPEMLWLGSGSRSWLKVERLKRFGLRRIVLFPDADSFELWQSIAADAQKQGLTVKTSNLIENHATLEQKTSGYDLADYLINQQSEINQTNDFVNQYNAKLETVLHDESLLSDFETILEEQKSILIIDGQLSEDEAERICTQPENLRSVVLGI